MTIYATDETNTHIKTVFDVPPDLQDWVLNVIEDEFNNNNINSQITITEIE